MNHIVDQRMIFTYAPKEDALGLISGYGAGTMFVVEHLVVFPGSPETTLRRMVRAALHEAWERYAVIVFCLPTHWILTSGLRAIGQRLGFVPYATVDGFHWFVAWKP